MDFPRTTHLDPMQEFVRCNQRIRSDIIQKLSLLIGAIGSIIAVVGITLATATQNQQIEILSTTMVSVGFANPIITAIFAIAIMKLGSSSSGSVIH